MFVIKSDHQHKNVNHPQTNEEERENIESIVYDKKQSQQEIVTKPVQSKVSFSDFFMDGLESSLESVPKFMFEIMTFKRKQIQNKVYTSLVQSKIGYLQKLFQINEAGSGNEYLKKEIMDITNDAISSICEDIMSNDEYEIRKKAKGQNKMKRNDHEAAIKIRQRILRQKIIDLRVDMENEGSQGKTKKTEEYLKNLQREHEQIKKQRLKREEERAEREKKLQEEKRQMEARAKIQKHEFLKKQFEEKRKIKQQKKKEQSQKNEDYKQFLKEYKDRKPLYKKKEEQFFKNYVLPEHNKKVAVLNQIKSERKHISLSELKEHEKSYLQIKEENEYEKNAARMFQLKAKRPNLNYYRSKFHEQLQKEENEEQDKPLERKTELYEKRWQYSTQIKTKFAPKVSLKKQKQLSERIEKEKTKKRMTTDGQKDGKNNLDRLHRYIAQLKSEGKIKQNHRSIEQSTKPQYRNYLRELETEKSARHSIDYGSLENMEYAAIRLRRKEESALRREQYLNNVDGMELEKYMKQKQKIDEDYLQSAKGKASIISKYL